MVALKLPHPPPPGAIPHRKQERRGGIETGAGDIKVRSGVGKQERRGGIETRSGVSICFSIHSKQERRGGIETETMARLPTRIRMEAGTPWWH